MRELVAIDSRRAKSEPAEPRSAKSDTPNRDPGTARSEPRLATFLELSNDRLERGDDFVALDSGLGEAQLQLERFGGGLVAENVGLGPPGLGFGSLFSNRLARDAPFAGDFLHQGDHFLVVSLSNYLQKQRFGVNV